MDKDALKLTGVVLLFEACGVLSSLLMFQDSNTAAARLYDCEFRLRLFLAVPLPFAVLCLLLLIAPVRRPILALFLNIAIWFVAYGLSFALGMGTGGHHPFVAMCAGGIVGGLGVTLCAAIGHRGLLSIKHLVTIATIGGLSALPFGYWLDADQNHPDPLQPIYFRLGFVAWQAAVGTYLYAVCTRASKKAQQGDSQGASPGPAASVS